MSAYRFGLEFAGKAEAMALLDRPRALRFELDAAASLDPDAGEHVFIEGDNLDVLQRLRTAYDGRVSLVYLDPPYNTGHDFVYRDRFAVGRKEHLEQTGQIDDRGERLVANPSSSGRFHSVWLGMMLPRLWLCRQLLRDDGLLMCSIDDHEVHRLRLLLDEVFGEDCFVAQVVVVSNRGGRDYLRIATGHEYVLVYGASPDASVAEVERPPAGSPQSDEHGVYELRELRNRNPKFHPGNRPNLAFPIYVADAPAVDGLHALSLVARPGFATRVEPRNHQGNGSVWRWGQPKVDAALRGGDPRATLVGRRRKDGGFNIYEKYRKTTRRPRALWDEPEMRTEAGTAELRRLLGEVVFDHPKPVALVRRCIQLGCPPGGIVLDPFAGSGTTMHAVLEQNEADGGARRGVCIQVPQPCAPTSRAFERGWSTISAITRARVQAAWSEVPGVSLRCFRAVPTQSASPEASIREGDAGADAFWDALVAQERRRDAEALAPFDEALHHGLSLDATRSEQDGFWILRDKDNDRILVGLVDPANATLPPRPQVPEGTPVVLEADALERFGDALAQEGFRVVERSASRL